MDENEKLFAEFGVKGLNQNAKQMDENEVKAIQKKFAESGVKGLNKYAEEKLEEWKKTPVNLAVVGQSGAGKSTFINKIRDMYPKTHKNDNGYAKVGSTQTTMTAVEYQFPGNEMIKLWDLPGAGTKAISISTYAKDMDFKKYDAFIILSACRFTEVDSTIAKEIEKMKKPFYFGRTKMDDVMISEKEENDLSEEETKKKIVDDCQKNLGEGYKTKKIYLLSKTDRKKYTPDDDEPAIFTIFEFPDNEEIKKSLIEGLPSIQRTALVLSMAAKSQDMITKKVEELKSRIIWRALASGVCGAIPVPGFGLVIALPIVASEIQFQVKQLGIDGDSIKENAENLGMTFPQFKQRIIEVAVAKSSMPVFFSATATGKLFDFLLAVKFDSTYPADVLVPIIQALCTAAGVPVGAGAVGGVGAVGAAGAVGGVGAGVAGATAVAVGDMVMMLNIIGSILGSAVLGSAVTVTGTATVLNLILNLNEAVARACLTLTNM